MYAGTIRIRQTKPALNRLQLGLTGRAAGAEFSQTFPAETRTGFHWKAKLTYHYMSADLVDDLVDGFGLALLEVRPHLALDLNRYVRKMDQSKD